MKNSIITDEEVRCACWWRGVIADCDSFETGELCCPKCGKLVISEYDKKLRRDEFEFVVKPVIAFINKHYHPHVKVIVDCNSAELVEGEMSFVVKE